MKINDFIFRFKSNGIISRAGICRVRTFINSTDGKIYVVLSELDENPSTSVTNAVEGIVFQLISAEKIPASAIIIEHYPITKYSTGNSFDIVSFDDSGIAVWKPIGIKTAMHMLEAESEEFGDYRTDARVTKEIYDAVKGIPKLERFEYTEAPEISERRLEIEANQRSISEIENLLRTNPSEAAIAEFIKSDMSLIAEEFAYPTEEYICFTEFPVGEGRVDFVVFTGRSRMSVYLIEIKGAKKSLRRKNHYGALKAEIQEGHEQLLERASWCNGNYEKFRKFTHNVLAAVKKGKRPYGAFLGPRYQLNVDPEKDIHLMYVLIAGRTEDDLSDSKKRHLIETSSGIDLQTETWDSWLSKLTRS